jgi:hypothetical protein
MIHTFTKVSATGRMAEADQHLTDTLQDIDSSKELQRKIPGDLFKK